MNCIPQTFVCNEEEVVCSCTADCSEVIHWWNSDVYFCTSGALGNTNDTTIPGSEPPVHVEVLPNNCTSNSGTFTSQLNFNVSLDVTNNTDTQIGCYISPKEGGSLVPIFSTNNPCTPRGPLDREQNSNITLRVENCTGMEKHLNTVLQSHP